MAKRKDRTIFTPRVQTADLTATGEKLVYWKQILPEAPIQYTQGGHTRTINFDKKYHRDVIDAFQKKAVDQTCFQLANPLNGHGRDFDPERQRAEVLDMATLDQLPDDVKEKVGGVPGVYAKMRFFNKKAAKSVRDNPGLGVSARVRENFTRADGQFVKRAVIHVLGTIDPRVTGMSGWQAADLSYDPDNGYVLDLSNETYEGNVMAKGKGKNGTVTLPSDEEIEAMTDEELAGYLADGAAAAQEFLDAEDEDDSDEDEDEDEDDSDDEDEDDSDDEGAENRELQTTGASLSNKQRNELDLANAQAKQANERANAALKRQAAAEFKAYRTEQILLGVPPEKIDLAENILNRADSMVVDLSNTGDEDVDVTDIVRALVEGYQGTIDMSVESGHAGSVDLANGDDPDQEMLDAWDDVAPLN
jgi:hypothetical protein